MHNPNEWRVELSYSCDHLAIGAEPKRASELCQGGDLVTKTLNELNIQYTIQFMSDFYYADPILERVIRHDQQGKEHVLYRDSCYSVSGPRRVLRALEELGVLPPAAMRDAKDR